MGIAVARLGGTTRRGGRAVSDAWVALASAGARRSGNRDWLLDRGAWHMGGSALSQCESARGIVVYEGSEPTPTPPPLSGPVIRSPSLDQACACHPSVAPIPLAASMSGTLARPTRRPRGWSAPFSAFGAVVRGSTLRVVHQAR